MLPASFLERRARGRDRAGSHDRRIDARLRPRHDPRQRGLAALLGFARAHQHDGGGAVVDAGGATRRHRAFLVERRTQLRQRVHGHARLRIFVGVDHRVALAGLDGDRRDLVLELAGLHRRLGLVLRLHRELVLHLAGDLPLLGDVLSGGAHVIAVEGIPQAVLDHGVDHLEVAHLHAVAKMRAVRRLAHRFLAAGDDDVAVAVGDRLIAERDRAQAGAAQHVDLPGRRLHRNAGADRGLPAGILAFARRQDLAHDHFGDVLALDPGAIQRRLDRDLSELVRWQRRQRPVERADGGTGGTDNDDVVFHDKSPDAGGGSGGPSPDLRYGTSHHGSAAT